MSNKISILLAFILTFSCKFAEAQGYVPFPTENAVWSLETIFGKFKRGVLGDTIINGLLYHKIFHTEEETFSPDNSDLFYIGAYREENKKIYFMDRDANTPIVWYDFNLEIEDMGGTNVNVLGYQFKVTSIDSILLNNNSYRKKYNFHKFKINNPVDSFFVFSWIEGIGSTFCHFNPSRLDCYFNDSVAIYPDTLECFEQEGEILFSKHGDDCSDAVVAVNEVSPATAISVFPNPVSELLTVKGLVPGAVNLSLYSPEGKLVLKKIPNIENNSFQLDLSFLPVGIYFIYMQGEDWVQVEKIIKY